MWEKIVNYLFYNLMNLNPATPGVELFHFIFYDFFKIIFMVTVIMGIITFLKTYIPEDKLHKLMTKNFLGSNYFFASFFGVITPFCSCSSIPIFMGLLKAGVPLGPAFSFLITSPLVNEVLIVLMFSYYGFKITISYVLAGMLIGIVGGVIISFLKLEKEVQADFLPVECKTEANLAAHWAGYKTIAERVNFSVKEVKKLLSSIYLYIFIGVVLGGVLHNYIPKEVINAVVGGKSIWAVPLAVLIGIPIYAGCSTVAPMIFSITTQGVPIGTALSLLMAISGLSLPEALILKSALKLKLLIIFFTVVGISIILIGYLFNFLYT